MRADRLVSLVLLLLAGGRTTALTLTWELEVSVRTIYRDLAALSAAGVPVCTESGPGGGCQLLEGYRFPLRGLRPEEAEALLIVALPGEEVTSRSGLARIAGDLAWVMKTWGMEQGVTGQPGGGDMTAMVMAQPAYPVQLSIDYPDRPLDRLTSFFRLFTVIPIAIVLGTVAGQAWQWSSSSRTATAGAGGLLFLGPLLMILFRQKYPRWWFDWNLELQRFSTRVGAYFALMDDRYPSTDDHQSVHLDYQYPDAARDLNRWLPLVKWLLAIPHYLVLIFLDIAAFVAVIVAWFAILFTSRYPRGLFDFVEGVIRWHNRVLGYAVTLVTDQYPPFRLAP